jgi:Uma2 family endonuclease
MAANAIAVVCDELPVRMRFERRMTDDELLEFCRRNAELHIERTPDGEIVIMPPSGSETGRRNASLIVQIGRWADEDGTGVTFDSSAGFLLPNGAMRAPDVAWIDKHRWEALTPRQRERFAPLCPDFVVELRSPSDARADAEAKMDEYMTCACALAWLIDPQAREVVVYRPGAVETLRDPATVSGEPVLPGFTLDLARVW